MTTKNPISLSRLVAAALLLSFAGCSVADNENKLPPTTKASLERPDRFVLYSLNPDPRHAPADKQSNDNFHGYLVLGSVEVQDPAEQKKLVDAFERGVAENEGIVAGCFNPRHGIRVRVGDKTIDLVICFECYSVNIYENGERVKGVLVTQSPQPTFDAVLKAAQVPLPGQAE